MHQQTKREPPQKVLSAIFEEDQEKLRKFGTAGGKKASRIKEIERQRRRRISLESASKMAEEAHLDICPID